VEPSVRADVLIPGKVGASRADSADAEPGHHGRLGGSPTQECVPRAIPHDRPSPLHLQNFGRNQRAVVPLERRR
jgi:hypothetical protein